MKEIKEQKIGVILSYVTIGTQILLGLFYTPYLTFMLGQSEFGLYSLASSVMSYLALLDFGFTQALIVYSSKFIQKRNKNSELNLYGTFFVIYLFLGFICLAFGLIIIGNVEVIFGSSFSAAELEKTKLLLVFLVINVFFSLIFSIFNSAIIAHEKFVFNKLLNLFRIILQPIVMVPLLVLGYKSVTLVLVILGINLIVLVVNAIYCFRYLNIKLRLNIINRSLFLEILSFSIFVFLGDFVEKINSFADNIILGVFCGASVIAVYAVAIQFVQIYRAFSVAITGVLLPRASKMETGHATNEEFSDLFIKTGRIQLIILLLILTGFIIFGQQVISFLFGQSYSEAYIIALIIMVPITIPHIQTFGINILLAKNKNKFRTLTYTFGAILNICISIILSQEFGAVGAAVGTGLSYFLFNFIVMNIYYSKSIGLHLKKFWFEMIKIALPILILFIGSEIVVYWIGHTSVIFLLIEIIIYTILYSCFVWLFVCNKYEKSLLLSILKKFKTGLFKK